ncbi:MerR family transcriptional regulator [Comamonas terrigena]|uniref:MerR family transcriptional regulator n=1 Tax=Comamonas terrigena TaxID=32013 RepID=UPI00244A6966|nr:MerR family transcriptional regulator [Comamonas terrigena]MDH1293536.1 MerR family transcriptional regulator [Comamonas terrigena]
MANLPPIPAKRYFTISEVALLCDVKPHVLRYWEQEFVQLRPMKRRGNRRYYQHHELLMVRRIRNLLYDEGFTIQGARNQLRAHAGEEATSGLVDAVAAAPADANLQTQLLLDQLLRQEGGATAASLEQVRHELLQIRSLLAL